MHLESLRAHCLSFPHATEHVQWGDNLVFKVAGKMFLIANLEAGAPLKASFKCGPEAFVELLEQDGIVPAPYMARAQWVAIERFDVVSDAELRRLLRQSYDLVLARLPAKTRRALDTKKAGVASAFRRKKPEVASAFRRKKGKGRRGA